MRVRRQPVPPADAPTVVDEELPPDTVIEEELVPPPPGEPPPRPLLWPWLLLLLALVIGGLVAAWLLTRDNGDKGASTVNVPNVVRLNQRVAVQRLRAKGLLAREITRTSTAAPGTVVAQSPQPGADLVRHSIVTLTVSAVQTAAVPGVVGQREAAAVSALRAKGFQVQTANVTSSKPSGTVIAQSPQAGSQVANGSTVTIRISRGLVTVPETVGQTRNDARAPVRGAGLKPKAFLVPSSQPKNQVVAQKPQGGRRVPGGSTVRLNISSGSTAAVPPPPAPAPAPPPPPARPRPPHAARAPAPAAAEQAGDGDRARRHGSAAGRGPEAAQLGGPEGG